MDRLRGLPILASAFLLASCATTPASRYVSGDLSDDISGIETAIRVTPTTVSPSEGADVEITIANTTDRGVQIRFPGTRQVVLLILDTAGDVDFADDRTIAVPTYLSVGPMQDWHYTLKWDGRIDIAGRRLALPPGRYRLQAGLRRSGILTVNRTDPVDIEMIKGAD